MKTKIEYSLDLQDVPEELKTKLQELSEKVITLGNYISAIGQDLDHENIGVITARIDRTRRNLLKIDNGLDDCDLAIRTYGDTVREIQQQQRDAAASQSTEGADE